MPKLQTHRDKQRALRGALQRTMDRVAVAVNISQMDLPPERVTALRYLARTLTPTQLRALERLSAIGTTPPAQSDLFSAAGQRDIEQAIATLEGVSHEVD